jgi:Kef-type K+ transport system membrane component KefB
MHAVATVVLDLAIILVVAKLAGSLASRLGQPSVLGELFGGVLLGNLSLAGVHALEPMKSDPGIAMLAEIGVLVLLFEVGLESTVGQMLRVGVASLLVALLGVAVPFALGWGVAAWLLPEHSSYLHMFIGATLCATSVGITARVLKDLGESQSDEARIILGAAVIDDILGLVILAVVTGIITAADSGTPLSYGGIGLMLSKTVAFLVGAIALGVYLSPILLRYASRIAGNGGLLAYGLASCFVLSWGAHAIGLAPIVGAFAAGLVLEDVEPLEDSIQPIASFLVPVFFVLMGMHTDLRNFADPTILGLAAALTVAAIVGKQACSLGVIGGHADRLSIGIGMIPRGEVGLIFASIGLGLAVHGERIVDGATYAAVVVMVIVTTLVTPPALKWSLARRARRAA